MADDRLGFFVVPNVVLTANSTATLSSSELQTRSALLDAIKQLPNAPNTTISPSSGHYITPVGDSRVVWTRRDDRIVVLTIFAPNTQRRHMSLFQKLGLSYGQAEKEVAELRTFMNDNAIFPETQIVKELQERSHASCLMGSLIAGAPKPDLYKFEFQLLGAFKADLVVGSSLSRRFVFVEFEGGGVHSLFGPGGTAQMRDWSKELEHGFGQLVDWAWTVNDATSLTI